MYRLMTLGEVHELIRFPARGARGLRDFQSLSAYSDGSERWDREVLAALGGPAVTRFTGANRSLIRWGAFA